MAAHRASRRRWPRVVAFALFLAGVFVAGTAALNHFAKPSTHDLIGYVFGGVVAVAGCASIAAHTRNLNQPGPDPLSRNEEGGTGT